MNQDLEHVVPEPELTTIDVDIPHSQVDLGSELYYVKLPNFLSVETRSVCAPPGACGDACTHRHTHTRTHTHIRERESWVCVKWVWEWKCCKCCLLCVCSSSLSGGASNLSTVYSILQYGERNPTHLKLQWYLYIYIQR